MATISPTEPEDSVIADQNRKSGLLRLYCVILAITLGLLIVVNIRLIVTKELAGILLAVTGATSIIANIFSYRLSPTHYRAATWLFIIPGLIAFSVIYAVEGTTTPVFAAGLLYLAVAIMIMRVSEVVCITVYLALFTGGLYILQNMLALYTPAIHTTAGFFPTGMPLAVISFPVLGAVIILPMRAQVRLLFAQNAQLQATLNTVQHQHQTSQMVSQGVQSQVMALTTAAAQQSSGSQTQVAALSQISATLTELAATAHGIAAIAGDMTAVTAAVVNSTQGVIAQSVAVEDASTTGVDSVTATLHSNRRVNAVYIGLATTLTELLARSGEIRRIVALMQSLGDETHLLALNAAIEAAGTADTGRRFAVVASEVKALADRSIHASQTVAQILREIETKIMQAALSAESGRRETDMAVSVAEKSGAIIQALAAAITENTREALSVQQKVSRLYANACAIQAATDQQAIAANQAVAAVENLGVIAHQNAEGSVQVRQTATRLERLTHGVAVQGFGHVALDAEVE